MDIVTDTNIFLAVALEEAEKNSIIQSTIKTNAVSPEILPYEIGNALTAMVKRKQITTKEALTAFKLLNSIPIRLVSVDIQQSLKLAFEYNIYAYDAYFLQCCKQYSAPLITLDKRMKDVAHELDITVIELGNL